MGTHDAASPTKASCVPFFIFKQRRTMRRDMYGKILECWQLSAEDCERMTTFFENGITHADYVFGNHSNKR